MCRQAEGGCWCAEVPRLPHGEHVVLLSHPREARNSVGTVRMAHHALPGSELLVGVAFADDPRFRARMDRDRERSVVVYPSPDARPLAELAARPGPVTLWVIDGTWWQAHKVWRQNPELRALPAYRLDPAQPSTYVIRREPAPHCLSTVEAIAGVLDGVFGPPGAHAAMLAPLAALVARQLGHAHSDHRSPRRRRERAPRPAPSKLPPALAGHLEHTLIVHAEGYGWPGHPRPRPSTELLQLVAVRPATGERFGVVNTPRRELGPVTLGHLGLDPSAFADALPPAEVARRWNAFMRPDDVLCTWGHGPRAMLAEAGLDAPAASVDVRAWCHAAIDARPGRIEEALEVLPAAADTASYPGRGGRRLAGLEAIFRALVML